MNLMNKSHPLRNPLIFALDLDEEKKALELVEQTAEVVGGIKIGPRLMLRYGHSFLKQMVSRAPVFLDMKFFDIPSTMVSAVRAAFDMGVKLVTVHAQAGAEALEQLAKLESEYQKTNDAKILAVTILTSFDEAGLPPILKSQSIDQHVLDLVKLSHQSGIKGIVCSPHELMKLREFKDLYLVTPGIRLSEGAKGDQKRTMGPREAIELGAAGIVMGRPILEALQPVEFCRELVKNL